MRNMLGVLMVMVGAMGTTLGQIDNEFWFVPEVTSGLYDPIQMRIAALTSLQRWSSPCLPILDSCRFK